MEQRKTLVRNPVYLRRLSDGKIIGGWIVVALAQRVSITVGANNWIKPGDRFYVQLQQAGRSVAFTGVCKSYKGVLLEIEKDSDTFQASERSEERVSARATTFQMTRAEGAVTVPILDISPSGLGMQSTRVFPRGARLRGIVLFEDEIVSMEVEVAYCRPDVGAPGNYRIGVRIAQMAAADREMWLRTIERWSPALTKDAA